MYRYTNSTKCSISPTKSALLFVLSLTLRYCIFSLKSYSDWSEFFACYFH